MWRCGRVFRRGWPRPKSREPSWPGPFPRAPRAARIDAELGRLAAAGIRAGATEEDVLDRLAEELVPADETTQSAFNPAGDDPAAAGSTGRSVPASQPTETEE